MDRETRVLLANGSGSWGNPRGSLDPTVVALVKGYPRCRTFLPPDREKAKKIFSPCMPNGDHKKISAAQVQAEMLTKHKQLGFRH